MQVICVGDLFKLYYLFVLARWDLTWGWPKGHFGVGRKRVPRLGVPNILMCLDHNAPFNGLITVNPQA